MSEIKYGWMCSTDLLHELDPDNRDSIEIFGSLKRLLENKRCCGEGSDGYCRPVKVRVEEVSDKSDSECIHGVDLTQIRCSDCEMAL